MLRVRKAPYLEYQGGRHAFCSGVRGQQLTPSPERFMRSAAVAA